MNEITIIGSGPVGATSALIFLQNGWHVTLIDIGKNSDQLIENKIVKTENLKLYKGSDSPYDKNEFLKLKGKQKKWYTSKSKGGFSLVWGATWDDPTGIKSESWLYAKSLVDSLMASFLGNSTNLATRFCTCFDDLINAKHYNCEEGQLVVQRTKLAIKKQKCIMCGKCQTDCPIEIIWSSKDFLQICEKYQNFFYIDNTFIEKIAPQEEGGYLLASDKKYVFKNLIIAAGPVATAALLLKSKLTHLITLKDNQIITVPIITKKRVNHPGSFALSIASLNGVSEANDKFSFQLYSHPENFAERILQVFPNFMRPFLSSLLFFVKSRLHIGILYLDKNISDQLKLQYNDEVEFYEMLAKNQKLNIKNIKKTISSFFSNFNVWVLWPMSLRGAVGDSYHLGLGEGVDIDYFGTIRNLPQISIAGSYSLKELEPGPVTYPAMIQAAQLSVKLINAKT